MRKTILIDLDHTLLDTRAMKADLDTLVAGFGISRAAAALAYKGMRANGTFSLDKYLLHLIPDRAGRKALVKKFDHALRRNQGYRFDGVHDFLAALSAIYPLVLLTHGDRTHQMNKFRHAGLGSFFEKVIVTADPKKEKELLRYYKKYGVEALLIDDSALVVATARGIGIKVFKIKKGSKEAAYYRRFLERVQRSLTA